MNIGETNLDELISNLQQLAQRKSSDYAGGLPPSHSVGQHSQCAADAATYHSDKRFKSMLNLGSPPPPSSSSSSSTSTSCAPISGVPISMMADSSSPNSSRIHDPNRAKSMEFLLDDDNKSTVQVSLFFFFFFYKSILLYYF